MDTNMCLNVLPCTAELIVSTERTAVTSQLDAHQLDELYASQFVDVNNKAQRNQCTR
jgi:hypothetical protein